LSVERRSIANIAARPDAMPVSLAQTASSLQRA